MLVVVGYGLTAAAQLGFRVVVALWVKTPAEKGGVGWDDASTLGMVQSAAALVIIGFSFSVMPYASQKVGNLNSCGLFAIAAAPFLITVPMLGAFDGWSFLGGLTIVHGCISAFFTSYISLISIEISNSVHESVVGAANGLSQAIVALFSATSSLTLSSVYGWSIKEPRPFPIDYHLAFFIFAGIMTVNTFVTLWPKRYEVKDAIQSTFTIEMMEIKEDFEPS
jgi:hypothetical protein